MGAVRAMEDGGRLPMAGDGREPKSILGLGRLLSPDEVADLLGIQSRGVRNNLPGLRWVEVAHNRYRTAETWLIDWLESNAAESPARPVVEAGSVVEGGESGGSS